MELEWDKCSDAAQSRKEVMFKGSSGKDFTELMIHEQKFEEKFIRWTQREG